MKQQLRNVVGLARPLVGAALARLPGRLRMLVLAKSYRHRSSDHLPLVTIIVPCYNDERFLGQAMASVRDQSYRNLECIVVNDASTDGSRQVAAKFATDDDRFRVVDHATNRGLSASRNTGLREARGELITFLDADDALLPHTIFHRVLTLLNAADPAVAGSYSGIRQVAEESTIESVYSYWYEFGKPRVIDFIDSAGECPFNVHALLARVDVLRRFGGFDESMLHGAEDWDLWQRILRHGYVFVHTRSLGGIYRKKRGSMVRVMPLEHLNEGIRLIRRASTPLAPSAVVRGTPFVFQQPIEHYYSGVIEAKRIIQFATFCWLNGDHKSFAAALQMLQPNSAGYLNRHVNIEEIITMGIARFLALDWGALKLRSPEIRAQIKQVHERILDRMAAPNVPPYVALEENRQVPWDAATLATFRGRHQGERCFIVGNGPSLNRTDLSKLSDEITFGVNGIFYKTDDTGFRPTYYVVEDSLVFRDNLERIIAYEATHKFFPSTQRDRIPAADNVSFFLMNRGFYEKTSPNFRIPRFSADASDRLYCGQSVTYINLQLAYYMGFRKVYLIGVDFDYAIPTSAIVEGVNITSTEDDPNHFHPEYFGKGKGWHDPQLDQTLKAYQFADLVFRWDGRRIYNATKEGKLEVFERVDYDSLFPRRVNA